MAFYGYAQTTLPVDNTGTTKPIIKESIINNENASASISIKQKVPVLPNHSMAVPVVNKKNDPANKAKVESWMQDKTVLFVENKGQIADMDGKPVPSVLFKAQAPGMNLFITEKGLTYMFLKSEKDIENESKNERPKEIKDENIKISWSRIDMDLKGASIKKENIITEGKSTYFNQYFLAHCPNGASDVHGYEKVTIKEVYPKIDWIFYNSSDKGLKYDFVVHPGADPNNIKLLYRSKNKLSIDQQGNVQIKTSYGTLTENAPISYIEETKQDIATQFIKTKVNSCNPTAGDEGYETEINFQFKNSEKNSCSNSTLIIDPQLVWCTFYGLYDESALDITCDASGNLYVTGYTSSTNFPTKNMGGGAYFNGSLTGGVNPFIIRFDNNGVLIWATYYGGIGSVWGVASPIAFDLSGNLYIAGSANWTSFPTKMWGTAYYQGTPGGLNDIFILRFNTLGALDWATYYGGNGDDIVGSITCDNANNLYITGYTSTTNSTFPLKNRAGSYNDATHGGGVQDIFISEFNNAGALVWATLYGGTSDDRGEDIKCDRSGNVYVSGLTSNSFGTFPLQTWIGAYNQNVYGGAPGGDDAFILRFNNAGARTWATYFGGNGGEEYNYLAIDASDNVYLSGFTKSTPATLPLRPWGSAYYDNTFGGGGSDGYIARFNSAGFLTWCTYFGGNGDDSPGEGKHAHMTFDNCGNIFATFATNSTDMPARRNTSCDYYDPAPNNYDAFIVKFNSTGVIIWASYFGGDGEDFWGMITADNAGNVFFADNWSYIRRLKTGYPLVNPGGGAYFSSDTSNFLWHEFYVAKFIRTKPIYTPSKVNATGCSSCNGSATVNVLCGMPNYNYVWSNGVTKLNTTDTTSTISNLCPGNYSVTVSMMLDCIPEDTVINYSITGGTGSMTLSATGNSICPGTSATITASGGSLYTWSNGSNSSTQTVSPTITTTYFVTGSDGAGCTGTASCVVTISNNLVLSATGNTICKGNTATISVSGGNTYTWSNSSNASSQTVAPTVTTTYFVTGTNASGCTGTAQAIVTVNPLPYIIAMGNLICAGNSANIIAGGATTYTWNTNQTGSTIVVTPTITTTYMVTGINGNGCTNTATAIVTVNPKPTITVNSPTICNGANASITASGGTSYTWDTAFIGNPLNVAPATTTTYTVTGTDVNGCTNTAQAVVIVNLKPSITAIGGSTCAGSPINVTANNGITYTWSTGFIGNPLNIAPSINTTYTVTGTDVNGCTNSATAAVIINPNISIITTNKTICNGATIVVSASNGTSYTWNTGALTSDITVNPNITTTYYVTGINAQGCSGTGFAVVTVNSLPNIVATGGAICDGNNINISANNAITYTWNTISNNNPYNVSPNVTTTYTVTGTDSIGCTNTAQAVVIVNPKPNITANGGSTCLNSPINVVAGGGNNYTWSTGYIGNPLNVTPVVNTTYTVTGVDLNGCTNIAQATVTINSTISINTTNPAICNGNSTIVSAYNGTQYTWDTGALTSDIIVNPSITTTYYVTGINAQGCSGTGFAVVTVNSLPNVTANGGTICNGEYINISANNATTYTWNTGSNNNPYNVNPNVTTTYTVTGTDNNTCSNTAQAIVTVNPLPNVIAIGGTICNGDNINISASNGITYTWNTGSNNNPYNVSPNVTTTYSVTGTDNNNCVNTAQAKVIVNPLPNVTATGNPLCLGDKSTLTAFGANTYTWDNGLGSGNIKTVSPTISTVYIVTGTDINGCTGTAKVVICVSINSPVSVNNPTICYGTSVTLNASGVLTYTWNNSQTGNTITVNPNATTTYFVSGTDVNSCTNTAQSVVTVSPQISLNIINRKDASCGFANGSATVTASGGIPYTTGILNYNCIWSTGETTPIINNLKAGIYTVTVTDSIGCSAVTTVTIGDTPPVTLSISSTNASCFPNGTATVTIITGTQPYTYIWSNGQTTQTAININQGTFIVTVTDAKGCTATASVVVNENNPLSIVVLPTPEHCGKIDGTATANLTGGNPSLYTYLWDNGGTTKTISNLSQGNYIVTVNYGTCVITGTTTIGETYGPNADFTYSPSVLDIFENSTALFEDLSTPGGQQIVKWHWDFYDDNSTSDIKLPAHTYKNVGTYTVCLRVTDSENCVDSICKPIIIKDIFTVYIPNAFSPNSDMLNEAFIPQGYNIDPNDFQMLIFNRWGEEIYKTNDLNSPWNGRYHNTGELVQVGVYVYRVIVKELEGPRHEFIGRVTVVR
ncbi:MAG: gliding motility-associated C-terminal domain-containing protein [Bacteroidales bacterium]|nr:gliding motility-associated C-terminal domain-containing protein [Bacteroidales bacterium]